MREIAARHDSRSPHSAPTMHVNYLLLSESKIDGFQYGEHLLRRARNIDIPHRNTAVADFFSASQRFVRKKVCVRFKLILALLGQVQEKGDPASDVCLQLAPGV